MSRRGAGILSLLLSAGLLALLYRTMDARQIAHALVSADRSWVVISVAMILPITFLRAVRFYWVAPVGALSGVYEALRLTLVSSALNVFVPAKAGDLIKSYFVAKNGKTSAGVAIAIIVYERLSDLFGLIAWCLLGYLLGHPDAPGVPTFFWVILAIFGGVFALLITSERASDLWRALVTRLLPQGKLKKLHGLAEGWPDLLHVIRGRRRWILPFSLLLWLAHLFQIWLFTVALSARVPFTVCMSLSAVALLAGQLPLTFAGLGTRDVALVVLLARYMAPETAAAMGVLMSTRNFLPPLIGMPMMSPYVTTVLGDARRWRSESIQSSSSS
jgi:uncharacterized protein (TIRG00374 family)